MRREAISTERSLPTGRHGTATPYDSWGLYSGALLDALAKKGDTDEIVVFLRVAINRFPEIYGYHELLGDALGAKGDWDGAIASYREAIRLGSDGDVNDKLKRSVTSKLVQEGRIAPPPREVRR